MTTSSPAAGVCRELNQTLVDSPGSGMGSPLEENSRGVAHCASVDTWLKTWPPKSNSAGA
jgi:hypothetical protein